MKSLILTHSQLLKAVVNLPNSIDKNERNFSELDLEKFF